MAGDATKAETQQLQSRLQQLAAEKATLQLVLRMIERLNPLAGLDDLVRDLLGSIMDTIGGTNIKLYYWDARELHYVDFLGENRIVAQIEDPLARQVVEQRKFIEQASDAQAALLRDGVVPGACSWGFPLQVRGELIGVLTLENLHISSRSLGSYLPVFFNHMSLILSNEIRRKNHELAERALRASESQKRALFSAIPDLIFSNRRDGEYLAVHTSDPGLWVPPEVLHARRVEEVLPMPFADKFMQAYADALDLGRVQELNYALPVEGEERHFEARVAPCDEDMVITIVRDVTERTRAEHALRKSEDRYRRITEGLMDYQYRVRVEQGRAVATTHGLGCETVTGYTVEDFAADPFLWFTMIAPEDHETARTRVEQILEGQQIPPFEHRILRKDGALRWVIDTSILFKDATGRLLSYDGVVQDITERKLAEESLRASRTRAKELSSLLNSILESPHGVVVFALDVNYCYTVFTSTHKEVMKAIWDVEIVPGMNMLEAIQDPSDRAKAKRNFDQALAGEHLIRVEEYGNPAHRTFYEDRYSPVMDEAGRVSGVTVFVIDITDRKHIEAEKEKLEAQNLQLQKAESLARMAGSVAHHFNNKLQAVMGSLDLLTILPKGADPAKYLATARQATEQAAEVSRLLLVYLGQNPGKEEPHFLAELCRDSLPRLQMALPGTVTLETDCPLPGPVIHANAEQIQQVLTNLITNAWEALGDAGGCLRLSVRPCPAAAIPTVHRFPVGWQPQGSDYACLAVMDTGCGIAEADLEKLFDPFFSTKFIGRGLGLSVVLGMVQAHHGVITVESQPGQGSVFRVYWPVSTEAVPGRPEPAVQAAKPEGGGTRPKFVSCSPI
jgi:PAS domain S-box-containing protein